jgi:predicted phage tail protein
MLRAIKVYGSLAKFLGARSFMADVKSPAEAVRFLIANFPGIEAHMNERHYKVSVGRFELEAGLQPDQLLLPAAKDETIRITPVVAGAGAVGRIIAGVALIAVGLFVPGIGALGVQILVGVGASLVLGGVAQLLTPTPTMQQGTDSQDDPRKSYSFSGIQNVSRQGVPVPIVYGETIVGSVVISAGINTEEVPV